MSKRTSPNTFSIWQITVHTSDHSDIFNFMHVVQLNESIKEKIPWEHPISTAGWGVTEALQQDCDHCGLLRSFRQSFWLLITSISEMSPDFKTLAEMLLNSSLQSVSKTSEPPWEVLCPRLKSKTSWQWPLQRSH